MRSVLAALFVLLLVTVRLPQSEPLTSSLAEPDPIIVNAPDDADDGVCDASHCSLREAIALANTTPGAETITFSLSGAARTILPTAFLPPITDAVLIDGSGEVEIDGSRAPGGSDGLTVQGSGTTIRGLSIHSFEGALIRVEGASGITIEDNVLGLNMDGLGTGTTALAGIHLFDSSDNTVRASIIAANDTGVLIEATSLGSAARNVIAANFIGVDASGTEPRPNWGYGVLILGGTDNLVGGPNAADRNVIAANGEAGVAILGTELLDATGNHVQGNYLGTTADGSQAIDAQQVHGVKIELSTSSIIEGNLIGGPYAYGIWLFEAHRAAIRGNMIGMDASGTQALSPGGVGLFLYNASENVIGGTDPGDGNRIGGNRHGVWVFGRGDPWGSGSTESTGNLFQGNHIAGNAGNGIQLMNFVSGTLIGGTIPGAANQIAGNGGAGVLIDQYSGDFPGEEPGRGAGNLIVGNAITGSGTLGIDLDGAVPAAYLDESGDGPTANDPLDADDGLNGLQNFPVLSAARSDGAAAAVEGVLSSKPNTTYTIDFYASIACGASGETYLGAVTVTTDAGGNASIAAALPAAAPGQSITATATDPQGSTSEFSACAAIEEGAGTTEPAMLINGSFEANAGGDRVPDSWTAIRLTGRNGQDCGRGYEGACSVRFASGNGAGLSQIITVDGQTGDTYTLSLWARANRLNQRSAVEARLILHYVDGTSGVRRIRLPNGTYDWRSFDVQIESARPIARITVALTAVRIGGTAWIDDVALAQD